jgi:moderate conductance mechanosensitive channel
MWHRLFTDPVSWRVLLMAVLPAAAIAWLAARLARAVVAALMRTIVGGTLLTTSPLVRAPLRLIELISFALVFSVLIFPACEAVGLHPRAGVHLRTLAAWAFDSGLKILLIGVIAFAVIRLVGVGVKRFENDVNFGTGLDALERAKRARTLGSVLTNVTTVVVLLTALLTVLNEFGVNISPALTGAGIVGIALGFGAQNLVKDLIAGFFLILENQVRVGDVAVINGTGGLVEAINLRTIILRDEEGTVHVFPNGGINTLANRSKDFSYYVVNLPLAYGEDPDAATSLLKQIAEGMAQEDRYKPFILAPLDVIGVDSFEENAIRVKIRIKTAPLKQWEVGRELRRRISKAFQERDIYMWGHHTGPVTMKK